MSFKRIISLLLILVLMFSIVACGNEPAKESGNSNNGNEQEGTSDNSENSNSENGSVKYCDKQEITYCTGSIIETMDPAMAGSIPSWGGQGPVYENLLKLIAKEDGKSELVPGVAENYDVSDDGLVYTFHLRKNAKWADGVECTADDFLYAWQRVYDPNVGHVYSWMVESLIEGGYDILYNDADMSTLGVEAPDKYTVKFTLAKQSPFFLQFAAFPTYKPVRRDLVEKYGDEYGSSVEKTVGNGPYKLVEWDETKAVYEPNEYYWDKEHVYLTKITRQIIKEVNATAQALIANEVDYAGLNDPQWNDLVDNTGIYNVVRTQGANIENFIFNCEDSILKNQKIRLAISLAFDRERYNNEYLKKLSVPAYSMCPTCIAIGDMNYNQYCNKENEYIKVLLDKYDPKELLKEGMKELGLGDDPSTITLKYMPRGTSEWSKASSEWLQQQLQEALGINIEIAMTEWNIMYDLIDSGDYQIAQGGWTGDYDDPSNFIDTYDPKTGYYGYDKVKWSGEKADRFTELVAKANSTFDQEERAKFYCEAEKILIEEAPVSPQYSSMGRTLIAKYIEGLYVNPNVYRDFTNVRILEH